MLRITYDDILKGGVITYFCSQGTLDAIEITGIPEKVKVREGHFSAGKEREKISFTSERKDDKVIITPTDDSEADTLSKCMLLKDALLLIPLNDEKFLLRLRIKCQKKSQSYDKFMLVLDLGNTRTCALTCSTLWDPSDIQKWKDSPLTFKPLTMRLNYKNDDSETCDSIFSSKCVLGTNVHKDWTRSFLQLDKNAQIKPEENISEGYKPCGRWQLSGPKRYFWRHDTLRISNDQQLSGATSRLAYLKPDNSNVVTEAQDTYEYKECVLDLPLVRAMSRRQFCIDTNDREKGFREGFFPYSIFLKGMLWELMEQAELQVNREKKTENPLRLSDLVVTFPAAWTNAEKEHYEKQIRETAELYAQQRCNENNYKINVDVTCDEGLAVFTTYLYSEYNARKAKNLDGKKVAVIDIGGGTSDLVIAEVTTEDNEVFNTRYKVKLLHTDGTYEAGDKFIFTLVSQILVPTVIRNLCPSIHNDKAEYNGILEALENVITSQNEATSDFNAIFRETLKSLVFSLWYPAALQLLKSIDTKQQKIKKAEEYLTLERKEKFDPKLCLEELGNIIFMVSGVRFEQVLENDDRTVQLGYFNNEMKPINIKSFAEQIKQSIQNTFDTTLEHFSKIIKDYGCDRVLFSGKISDLPLVQEVFKRNLKQNDKSIKLIPMNSYEYVNIPTENYINSDSKFATVTGAGLYRMANTSRLKDFDLKIEKSNPPDYIWGIFRDGAFKRMEKDELAAIAWDKRSVYLARKSTDGSSWITSFEFRAHPLQQVKVENGKPVTVVFRNPNFKPEWVSGKFTLDGNSFELKKGEVPSHEAKTAFEKAFEYRICKILPTTPEESNALEWLDSGMVFVTSKEKK